MYKQINKCDCTVLIVTFLKIVLNICLSLSKTGVTIAKTEKNNL